MPEMKSTREGYSDGLIWAGKDKRVVALDGDMARSTLSIRFKEKYPERFFEAGIAEQDLVTIAAGLAASGKIPFASTIAVFLTGRAYDQIRLQAGVSHLNIKLIGSHGGLLTGEDGATHQALDDISLMRGIPGMAIIHPADYIEAREATKAIAKFKGPVYLRLGREKIPVINNNNYRFRFGKGIQLKNGSDISIIATGPMVIEAIKAHELLKKHKISARIINIHTIKPIDKTIIIKAAKETRAIITAEDHSIYGGLGSTVAELLSESHPTIMERIGVRDRFGESGRPDVLYKKYGLTANHIVRVAQKLLNH